MTNDRSWFMSKLLVRLAALLVVVFLFFYIGDFVAAYLLYAGVEWIPLSSTGGIITCLGALVGLALMDRAIDLLFEKVLTKKEEDPE